MLVYELLAGSPPYAERHTPMKLFAAILRGGLPDNWRQPDRRQPSAGLSPEAAALCRALLVRDPGARLAAARKGGQLRLKGHAFFDGLDWLALEMRGLQPPRLPELSSDLDTRYVEPAANEPTWRPEDADTSTSLSTTALDSGAYLSPRLLDDHAGGVQFSFKQEGAAAFAGGNHERAFAGSRGPADAKAPVALPTDARFVEKMARLAAQQQQQRLLTAGANGDYSPGGGRQRELLCDRRLNPRLVARTQPLRPRPRLPRAAAHGGPRRAAAADHGGGAPRGARGGYRAGLGLSGRGPPQSARHHDDAAAVRADDALAMDRPAAPRGFPPRRALPCRRAGGHGGDDGF